MNKTRYWAYLHVSGNINVRIFIPGIGEKSSDRDIALQEQKQENSSILKVTHVFHALNINEARKIAFFALKDYKDRDTIIEYLPSPIDRLYKIMYE